MQSTCKARVDHMAYASALGFMTLTMFIYDDDYSSSSHYAGTHNERAGSYFANPQQHVRFAGGL